MNINQTILSQIYDNYLNQSNFNLAQQCNIALSNN